MGRKKFFLRETLLCLLHISLSQISKKGTNKSLGTILNQIVKYVLNK